MKLYLKIWRQGTHEPKGAFQNYHLDNVSQDISFLEMLDDLNESLIQEGKTPIAFDHDCREGICGACSLMINGYAHGPEDRTTACQLHMRHFKDGQTIVIEPWSAKAFPIIKDLVVDRSAFDRIVQAGGFITARTGSAIDGNQIPVFKSVSDRSMDAAACIGCGACVAACPNSSAMLFTAAKLSHLNQLPQGAPEKSKRVVAMVQSMDAEDFGNCTNHGECAQACPKAISLDAISEMNRSYAKEKVNQFLGRKD